MILNILYEDEQLLAVDKPSGQLVIPGRGVAEGEPLVDTVSRHIGSKAFVVHRIDRETSGVVLFAKNADSHRKLSNMFEKRQMHKTYWAQVLGTIEHDGRITSSLREFGSGRVGIDPKGKESLTTFHVLKLGKESTLLQVEPMTGRRHQIRVHLYSIGHPVMGDPLYGDPRPVGGASRLMLHAHRLEFTQEDGQERIIESPIPDDFTA